MSKYLAKLKALRENSASHGNCERSLLRPESHLTKEGEANTIGCTHGHARPRDPSHHVSALATLRTKCPTFVPEDRWRQAVEDGRQFLAAWGAKAQAFGWTARELFGLHPVPERPAPNYSRLSRLDHTGLIWLLRGRPVTMLTATEAVMRCQSGATLRYCRQKEHTAGSLSDRLDDVRPAP
jgi:hypothetical protein